jgi:hypothetical protein
MGSTKVQSWKKKELSTIRRDTAENSDDVKKRADTSEVKPKCSFDFQNTYIYGIDYTDQYLSYYCTRKAIKVVERFICFIFSSVYKEGERIHFQTLPNLTHGL